MAIPVKAQLIVFFRIGAGGLNTTLQPLSLNNVQVITAKQVSRVTEVNLNLLVILHDILIQAWPVLLD